MLSSWWRGSSGAITGRICRTEGVVKQKAKARVLANLYYDNIFCSLNSFFSAYPSTSSREHGPVSRRRCSCVPHAAPPTSCRASPPHLRHDDGALLTDNVRDEQTTRPQGQHGPPHGEPGVMQRPRDVKTRGCLTSEDLQELRSLAGEWWGLPRADRTTGRA